jgi:hypothetical protein
MLKIPLEIFNSQTQCNEGSMGPILAYTLYGCTLLAKISQ